MGLLDEILEFLGDGKNHSIYELSIRTTLGGLELSKGMSVLRFLQKYGFIHLGRLHRTARLSRSTRLFLKKIRWLEKSRRAQ